MLKLSLILGLCLVAGAWAGVEERARYDNYRVYKVIASNEQELAVLKGIDGTSDSIMFFDGIHFINRDIDVVVAPHKVPDFLEVMRTNDIDFMLVDQDLQAMLDRDAEEAPVAKAGRSTEQYNWEQYFELDDTYAWLQSLVYQYPKYVTLIEGGKTYQRRSILGVKISYGANKPGIFLEAGIHAREWIAPATATYIINQLLTSSDPSVRNIAESYDWYVFPHANPDGYVYTHTNDRLWRKTRTPYGSCFGADPNRNWAYHWNEVGASSNPCSDTYAGPSAFSEIETYSLANYIESLGSKIHLYVSFHAYSQYLLYPYGHTGELPPNVDDLKQVFNVATAAINKRYSTTYTGGNIYDAIYPAAGASVDWAYGVVGVKMSFCYELRPSSTSYLTGFRLPADKIIPTGEETLDSIVAMVGEVDRLGYFN